MPDAYRVLVAELEQGSDRVGALTGALVRDGYTVDGARVGEVDDVAGCRAGLYDAVVLSMDDAHDVSYDGDVLDDRHVVLEGVTPLRQPGYVDAAYNTADRVERTVASIRRDEWTQVDGVGADIAAALDGARPGDTTGDDIDRLLSDAYGDAAPMLAERIDV